MFLGVNFPVDKGSPDSIYFVHDTVHDAVAEHCCFARQHTLRFTVKHRLDALKPDVLSRPICSTPLGLENVSFSSVSRWLCIQEPAYTTDSMLKKWWLVLNQDYCFKLPKSKAFRFFLSTLLGVLSPLFSRGAEKETPPFILHVQGV